MNWKKLFGGIWYSIIMLAPAYGLTLVMHTTLRLSYLWSAVFSGSFFILILSYTIFRVKATAKRDEKKKRKTDNK